MKLVVGLLLSLGFASLAPPAFGASRMVFDCEGQRLDVEGNELGEGKSSIRFSESNSKIRVTFPGLDADPIDLETYDADLSGHTTVYHRAEQPQDGLAVGIMSTIIQAAPNDGFYVYVYIYRQKRGLSDKSYMLNCKRR